MTTASPAPRRPGPSTPRPEAEAGEQAPWWVGHPIVRYPIMAVLVGAALSWRVVDGETGTLVGAALTMPVGILGMVSSVLHLRGTLPPLGPRMRRTSPVAGVLAGAAVVVASVTLFAAELVADIDDDGMPYAGGLYASAALVATAVLVQVVSLADSWPDRWRPPHARRSASVTSATSAASADSLTDA